MKCPELQHLTASEPLEPEYDMLGSWREDDDKCTFIILDKQRWTDPSIEEEQCTVGDVNMFLMDQTDLSSAELEIIIAGDPQCAYLKSDSKSKAEYLQSACVVVCTPQSFPVYISLYLDTIFPLFSTEPSYRGKAIGKEVTHMMMRYGEHLIPSFRRFRAGRQKLKVTV
uniref:N-acetyltransferase 9-like protein n=1 Tax=Monopterus albus TaxID=43700 RepID=UPI0009B38376|nr:N-acetyltransferase 9-like protein [Monopterus albus]